MEASRSCPICHESPENAKLFLDRNIDPAKISSFSYASRKDPEYMCHRLLRCGKCDLVYVDQPPEERELAHAYHVADYDSSEEAGDAAAAYIKAVRPILASLKRRERALEIGAGTGVFLERLSREGFRELTGVEPSSAAIAAAPAERRGWIREGIFREEDFKPDSFDLICCFMTMEHVRDPNVLARAAYRLLRPGGAFIIVVHDYRSFVNRVLGKRSPIIDIEHMQLFSRRSAHYLFQSAGYQNIAIGAFANRYALRYWLRLMPLPQAIKRPLAAMLAAGGLDGIKVALNVGNLLASGIKGA